jgi:hypothetical protein
LVLRSRRLHGHLCAVFRRALKRGDLLAAERLRRRSGRLSLEALDLTSCRPQGSAPHPRVAARWLRRYLDEHHQTTIDEAALAASCLAALPGFGQADAAKALRAMTERATRRRRVRGVA